LVYKEAMESIARSKAAMARMDREDAEFWSGLIEGASIAAGAVGEGVKEYQKSSSQKQSYKLKNDSWKDDKDKDYDSAWNNKL